MTMSRMAAFVLSCLVLTMKIGTTIAQTCPHQNTPYEHCEDPYTCWKDESTDTIWVTGRGHLEPCRDTCEHAIKGSSEFHSCDHDMSVPTTFEELNYVANNLGFQCQPGGCGWGFDGVFAVDNNPPENCDRTCLLPQSPEAVPQFDCWKTTQNANCFNQRYWNICPCKVKPLDEACSWPCPDFSSSVAKWPEDIETGTSCLARINYWRKRACEEGWAECPPEGLPPMVECTKCHECANTQSVFDEIHGAHSSSSRCSTGGAQGSGAGPDCAAVIDAFVSERDDFEDKRCTGHCWPIVDPGCESFSWGVSPNGWYTLNWGGNVVCSDECVQYCDSVEGSPDACFPSGMETPSCSVEPTFAPAPTNPSTPTNPAPAPTTPPPNNPPSNNGDGYCFLGCYADTADRDLPLEIRDGWNHERCHQACLAAGKDYFGMQYQGGCYCGDSYGKHGEVSCGDCSETSTNFGAWKNCVYATNADSCNRAQPTTTTTIPEPTASLYSFVGCYADNGDRDLPLEIAGAGTHELCYQACLAAGKAYFGMQYQGGCYCGDSYGKHGAVGCDDCSETSSNFGAWKNCVYDIHAISAPHPTPAAPSKSPVVPALPYRFLGCFADNGDRDLPLEIAGAGTHELCYQACLAAGKAYFGLQWKGGCYCGDSYGKHGAVGCDDCSETSTNFGAWKNCVYEITDF